MKKNRLLLIISSLVAIYAIIGFIAVPKLLKPQIKKAVSENITEQVSLGKIEFNPFILKFTAHNFKIFNEKETTVSVEKLLIDFSIFKSIDEQHISFKNLELVNPYVNIIEYEDGSLNLQKLPKEKKEEDVKKEEEEKKEASDLKFQIYKTILDDARIKFTKLSKSEEPFTLDINKLNYTFYDMGTFRNTLASHTLRILINNNSELIVKGGLRLDPFKMNGNVELNNFKPNEFLTYKKDMLNFDLSDKTSFDLAFGYKIDTTKKLQVNLENLNFNLKNLDILQNKNSILSLKNLAVEDLNLYYPNNSVNINSVILDKLNSKVIIDKDKGLNFANLIKVEEKSGTYTVEENNSDKKEVQVSKTTEIKKETITQTADNKSEPKNNPWKVTLNKLQLRDSNISFNDIANMLLVDTKNINIDLSKFKLDGNNFYLNNLSLTKPTINIEDKKNKLNILNKELEVFVSNLKSEDSILSLEKIDLKQNTLIFKDLKNSLDIQTGQIAINLNSLLKDKEIVTLDNLKVSTPKLSFKDFKNELDIVSSAINLALINLEQKGENINLKKVTLSNPKITFKDNKNELQVFTKRSDITVSNINKDKNNISIESIALKNPSIYVKDNKNKLKVITQSLKIDMNKLNLNNGDIKLKKLKVRTPEVKFNDIKNKLEVTTKNINLIASNTSLIKEKLKIAILSLTKPSIYFVDNKNDTTVVAKKISLKINNLINNKGSTYISKVNLNEPDLVFKDKKSKMDLVAKNIYLNVQKISHKNNKLEIVKSSINKPYISITLGKQDKVEKKDEKVKIEEKEVIKVAKIEKKKGDFAFNIGPVKINKMKMTFEDKNLPIPFKTDITELNGNFSRLNSNSSKPTKLQLEGKVDEYGYTKITGTVDINDIKLLTDTNLLFKNIAIKNFTPYTGKFIGREIAKGKLDLDLKYNIKKSDLNAQNSVVISDIKLGKSIDSPDAVSLPLELAIALLEDSNGVIDLQLPVSGNVDDPQFSIAPIVWKVFTNLIVKAITAPFTLLASVFGFDEESIKSLEFEYGKSEIIASEKETLDNISKILSKKPKLAIVIKPTYDPIKDKIALQDIKFNKFLEKEMKEIPEGDEYQEALEDLYEDIDGVKDLDDVEKSFTKKDKKENEIFNKEEYVEYLRKFLSSRQEVSEKDLLSLANTRVQNISKYLIEVKKIKKDGLKIDDMVKQDKKDAKWVIFNLDVATK